MTDAQTIRGAFRDRAFIVDEAFATALQIMLALEKPLLIEGPAGVGKTESAKVLAEVLGTELIRLQCYEGLDAMAALYEWNYPRQMLHARLSEAEGSSLEEREAYMFSERFLLKRPLLDAITRERSPTPCAGDACLSGCRIRRSLRRSRSCTRACPVCQIASRSRLRGSCR